MKKHLLGWVAMAGMLFVTSCAKDVDVVAADSSEAVVTLDVSLESALSTRTIGDGLTAKSLYYAAIDEDGKVVYDETVTMDALKTTVTLTLVKNKEYTVAFWAQSEAAVEGKYYDLSKFPTVTVSYKDAKNNDESRDAFYGSTTVDLTKAITTNPTVALKRPFAQINFALLDENNSVPAKEIETSMMQVTSQNLSTSFDVVSGKADDKNLTGATFAVADTPTNAGETLTGKTNYKWLSMSYVLVSDKTDVNLVFTIGEKTFDLPNVSVQPNYRTNLLASDNTTKVDVEVEKQPDFTKPDTEEEDIPWTDGEETAEAVTVNDIDVSEKDGTVTFMAMLTIPNNQSVTEAYFICTPQTLTRADAEGVVRIKADVDDTMISKEGTPDELGLKAGVSYIVTVEVDGKIAEIESKTDAPAKAPELTIPGTSEPQPEKGTTPETAFTVAEAIAKAKEVGTQESTEVYYVKGEISNITYVFDASHKTATFEMIDAGVPDAVFTAYAVKYLDNADWVEGNDNVYKGDVVIVCGKIVNYNNDTPEIASKTGYLYQYVSKVTRSVSLSDLKATVGDDGKSVTFTVNYTNYSEVAISKAGFKYGIENTNTDKSVTAPTGQSGSFTANVTDLTPGIYTVKAYLNDIESVSAVTFKINDPDGEQEKPVEITLDFKDMATQASKNTSSYEDVSFDMTTPDGKWTLVNVNNNSRGANDWTYVKIGKKQATVTGSIATTWGVDASIATVTTNVKKAVTSATATVKLIVATDANFASTVDEYEAQNIPATEGDITFVIKQPKKGYYYKLEYFSNNTTGTNGTIQVNSVTLKN